MSLNETIITELAKNFDAESLIKICSILSKGQGHGETNTLEKHSKELIEDQINKIKELSEINENNYEVMAKWAGFVENFEGEFPGLIKVMKDKDFKQKTTYECEVIGFSYHQPENQAFIIKVIEKSLTKAFLPKAKNTGLSREEISAGTIFQLIESFDNPQSGQKISKRFLAMVNSCNLAYEPTDNNDTMIRTFINYEVKDNHKEHEFINQLPDRLQHAFYYKSSISNCFSAVLIKAYVNHFRKWKADESIKLPTISLIRMEVQKDPEYHQLSTEQKKRKWEEQTEVRSRRMRHSNNGGFKDSYTPRNGDKNPPNK
ncbi:uncharacterized protein J8A68_004239 [[Candida] subhashii]|uniref:Uncharacterized protein n=1 Tax=[Candida] subhashii TaxID=561895 RepID=A0A8J5QHP4_9ASCO|nr:uncharacterized protein J8A68_004239 [[Candida] subhashii]KAG7662229.1 hypothetical protein J8A68_004239 [[Candida] subhashii]